MYIFQGMVLKMSKNFVQRSIVNLIFSQYRYSQYKRIREEIDKHEGGLEVFSRGYEKLGFTRRYSTFSMQVAVHSFSIFF